MPPGLVQMKKSIFFIDGFNLYHSLNNLKYFQYKWLDVKKFCSSLLTKEEVLQDVYFFTAYATWNEKKVIRHKILLKALKSTGVKIVYGRFQEKTILCKNCNTEFTKYEEKKTDVNIAVHILKTAFNNEFDNAYLLTGDSDLVPAIETLKAQFPNKKATVVIPIRGKAYHLKNTCDNHIKIKEKHLITCRFPNKFTLADGKEIHCPKRWIK